ncbi:MAG TPA: methyltransferase domain-containing protein [Candidatus Limnocylindria bacterium]|nr:methyltransferase domain-containing protein [Candidatus Limnocylindria bacterium]
MNADVPRRRTGDAAAIPGSYQHVALTRGPRTQRYWHRAKLELVDWLFPIRPGEKVLDVGAGSGVFADRMAALGADVTAIDANPDAVAYARQTFGRPGLAFQHGLLDELGLPEASFDKATCLEVVEHAYIEQVSVLLGDLFRILKPGGKLLVTTPNFRGLWPIVEWTVDRLGVVAKMDADQHVTHFHRSRLARILREAGFEVERMRTYCTFAPFIASVSWTAARHIDRLERSVDLPFGNLLAVVAVRPTLGSRP